MSELRALQPDDFSICSLFGHPFGALRSVVGRLGRYSIPSWRRHLAGHQRQSTAPPSASPKCAIASKTSWIEDGRPGAYFCFPDPSPCLVLCIFLRKRLGGTASVFRFCLSVFVRIFSINVFISLCFSLTFRSPSMVPRSTNAIGTFVVSSILKFLRRTCSIPFY
jgi:hypothetical protein